MEALSPTMEEGRLVKWLKNEGDAVKSGETLAEVETDKAIMELVARGEGVLRRRLVAEGETVPVGSLVAVIAAPEESIDEILATAKPAAGQPALAPSAPQAKAATPAAETAAPEPKPVAVPAAAPPQPPAAAVTAPAGGRLRSSPLARRLARERGLDLGAVQGSGPGGRIVKRDVEALLASALAPAAPIAAPAGAGGADFEDVPLTQIRKTIARRLAESIGPVPTFYLTAEFDMERVAEMRSAMAELGEEYRVSFNDIVLKATAAALVRHPECNAHWLGDRIRRYRRVHLGMAVAVEEGLITPVIFDADRKSLGQIAAEARDLAQRARERRLRPEEYSGATFSVSNLGMFGIDQFTAIINPPEAGILAVGSVEPRPVAREGGLAVRRRMRVTMSCDHRVIDGATGARFLQTLRLLLENPLLLVY
jgi:pyruvate dehydrogenase E2 component (dihydrolipoamide acetyltransferase)